MASQYDSIKTPKELLTEVAMHGFSTKLEDICRAQDIFGRASIGDLVSLANDNGRQDGNGNPDPDGDWSSGRDGTRKYFYQVLFQIWHWEDATRFYNQHTNKEFLEGKEATEKLRGEMRDHSDTKKALKEQFQKTQEQHQLVLDERRRANDAETKALHLEDEIHDRDMQIMELKAKLYDMMMAQEGK